VSAHEFLLSSGLLPASVQVDAATYAFALLSDWSGTRSSCGVHERARGKERSGSDRERNASAWENSAFQVDREYACVIAVERGATESLLGHPPYRKLTSRQDGHSHLGRATTQAEEAAEK
jgi:hypothetical protein